MQSTLGVGFVGAGPVTQAIHLPTLARLGDEFAIRHVTDVDPVVAVAGRRSALDVDRRTARRSGRRGRRDL